MKRFYIIVILAEAEERLEFWLRCFLFLRLEHVHVNLLFLKKIVYNKIVRSLDYLNRCKVFLYVHVNITVLV